METSPVIPDKIVESFKIHFQNSDNYIKIVKPEICDVLVSTDTFRNTWFNEENTNKKTQELLMIQSNKDNMKHKMNEYNHSAVSEFKKVFYNLNNREPMDSEIIDNLKDKVELSTLLQIIEIQSTGENTI
jgi:hypothetical protein